MQTMTYKGETLRISEWSKRLGISTSTLCKRKNDGWPVERIVETPISDETRASLDHDPEKRKSKNNAEMWLNDLTLESPEFPTGLLRLIDGNCHTKRYGTYLRVFYRQTFNAWFREDYAKRP